MRKLVAFDFGASSGRAIMGKYDGNILQLGEVHRFSNDPVSLHGSFHWDVLRLFHEMKQGIIKCVKNGDGDIDGIGVDTWGVDFGLLGPAGELLGNPYHYRDARTEGMIEKACSRIPKKEIYGQTGIAFQKFNTLYQLLSMVENNSPLLDKASTLLLMPDLFNYFLTGEKNSEFTIVSTTQMYSPAEKDWARSMLSKLGIPDRILTKIINAGTVVGKLTPELQEELNVGAIPVIAVAGHDTGCAVASVPAIEGRYAFLSSGTWSLLGIESGVPVINETTLDLNYTNEGCVNNTTRLLKNIMGLWIYQECKRTWDKTGEVLSFDQLEAMAEEAMPFQYLIDPDDDIFFTPGHMPDKIQEFCKRTGQKIPESKGAMVRCIMESLALKYKYAIEGLEKIVGYKLPVVHIVGGGCKNVILSQFTSNATNKTVIAGPVEATAVGNLITQLMALGEVSNLKEARMLVKRSFPTKEYLPANRDGWDEAYERFLGLLK